ncbi:hypothetical protein MUA68_10880 [Staphylococcus aureus]|nr:hypothetical protein MUA78_04050 [Staphylococcus aureus]UXV57062.1 hypothetical protein MUA68_10880 [Staphylococcus aureus]
MKISKSEIARHMGVDRRTVDKYSNVFDLYFINSSIKITTLLNQ